MRFHQMPDRTFQEARHYIGASDFACLCGLDRYRTMIEFFRVMKGIDPAFDGNDMTKRGHDLEAYTISCWIEEEYSLQAAIDFRISRLKGDPLFILPDGSNLHSWTEAIDPSHSFIRAHTDVIWQKDSETFINLEGKTTSRDNRRRNDPKEGYNFKDLSVQGLPLCVQLQNQVQMHCYQIKESWVYVFVLDSRKILKYGPVFYDEKLAMALIERACEFWWHVKNNVMPDPQTFKDTLLLWPNIIEERLVLGETGSESARKLKRRYWKAHQIKKNMEAIKEGIAFKLNKYMQGKKELYTDDNVKIAGLSKTKNGYSVRVGKND